MSIAKFVRSSSIFVTMFAITGAMGTGRGSDANRTNPRITDYARPLSFEPNRGQTDKQVDFLAHGTGYSLFLSRAEAVMVLTGGASVRLKPVGANASNRADALDLQSSKSNYFIGNVAEQWRTSIPNYAKVRYRSVYPGIDLIYYGNQRHLEYDFVVSPGTDPGRISLDFQGPRKAELDRSGDLVMQTSAGDLRWHEPIAYQEVTGSRKLVKCTYVRNSEYLTFSVDTYDRSKPLIIDPVLDYSTVLGTLGLDQGNGIAVDADGNAYVAGWAGSPDFPTTTDAFQKQPKTSGAQSAFVTKLNTKAELVYSTYLGGSGFNTCPPNSCFHGDQAYGIAVGRDGNAYVTGSTTSSDFPVKNAFQPRLKAKNGLSNAFVTKLDRTGSALVYSTYLGGSIADVGFSMGDAGYGIAIDSEGNAYITGLARSDDFPIKNPLPDQPQNTEASAFVTKLCPAGNSLVYSTYLGGSNPNTGGSAGYSIAVDCWGSAYVTGSTGSPDFPTKNAFQDQLKSAFGNAFVVKFAEKGSSLLYSTYLGGSGDGFSTGDYGAGIAVDEGGDAYITGTTASTDFPTKNAFQPTNKTSGLQVTTAFVTKLCPAGDALVYSTYLGGSGNPPFGDGDAAFAITVDKDGDAYVTGRTDSPDFPVKNAFEPLINLGTDSGTDNAFVTKFDQAGTALVYSSFLGGSIGSGDQGNGIAIDREGNAYLTGKSGTGDFPVTNPLQDEPGGVFVAKVSAK